MARRLDGLRLTPEELLRFLRANWESSTSAAMDRISMHMLEALSMEKTDWEGAAFRYRFVIQHAQTPKDRALVLHTYFRLADVLERAGQYQEAASVVEQCARYSGEHDMDAQSHAGQRSELLRRRQRPLRLTQSGGPSPHSPS